VSAILSTYEMNPARADTASIRRLIGADGIKPQPGPGASVPTPTTQPQSAQARSQ